MKYTDRVYGKFEISEPVILELINCPSIQRLKGIDQAGYRPLWVKPDADTGKYDHSRFAHSLGVYLLLEKYNSPPEERIAGLIHDVSHSAFSHCIDYVLDSGSEKEQNHQDNLFVSFVRKTEIPGILEKYDCDIEYILNDDNFPLKEKDLPELCADRIDYSLRDAVIFGELNKVEKDCLLDNLAVEDKKWFFKNFKSAKRYAELFLKLNREYYAGFSSALMFRTVSDYLRYVLRKKYINKDDLYATDKTVLSKIEKYHHKDKRLNLLFERMNKKVGCKNNPEDYDARMFCKSRAVDPLCKHNGLLKRISEIDAELGGIIHQELKPKKYFLKFSK